MVINGETLPYDPDGWTHCCVCDTNKWDEDMEDSECAWEDDSRDWWMICKTCFANYEKELRGCNNQ